MTWIKSPGATTALTGFATVWTDPDTIAVRPLQVAVKCEVRRLARQTHCLRV